MPTHPLGFVGAGATLLICLSLVSLSGCGRGGADAKDASANAGDEKADAHHGEAKLTADAITQYRVQIGAATRHELNPTLVAPARVTFDTEAMAHVGAVLRGRVVELRVRKGDVVKQGDVLLVVESPELGEAQSDYLQKKTAAQVAGPVLDLSKSAYARAKELYDNSQGIALTDLQKREAEYRAAQGTLASAQSALVAAENKLHLLGMSQKEVEEFGRSGEVRPRYDVRAPIAGRVVDREVTLGELVSPDKEALLVLADMSALWVIADVPETSLGRIVLGANARVRVSDNGTPPIEGVVSLIDSVLDPNTRTGRVRIVVKNNGGAVRPGMFAQAEVMLAARNGSRPEPVLAVPEEAVQTLEGATAVFVPVAGEENTFAKRRVAVGKAVAGWTPVISGLKEGEPLVTRGSFILKAELGKGTADED